MEYFGFAAPIGFGNGHVRTLRHNEGAPSSCNKAYGVAKRGQILLHCGEEIHRLVSNIHRSNLLVPDI